MDTADGNELTITWEGFFPQNRKNMTMLDIRTASERERDARHKKVCDLYVDLLGKHKNVKPSRIMTVVATELAMTSVAVRNIVIANGLYSPKHRKS